MSTKYATSSEKFKKNNLGGLARGELHDNALAAYNTSFKQIQQRKWSNFGETTPPYIGN
jgi:hypothetical protein